jgi:hypothetical protein
MARWCEEEEAISVWNLKDRMLGGVVLERARK